MSDQFGVTLHGGYKNPVQGHLLEGYSEPRHFSFVPKAPKPEERAWSFPKGLDVYNPVLDGYSYSSQHLLQQIKRKKYTKGNGPLDVYRVPIVTSMEVGWFLRDMEDPDVDLSWAAVRQKRPFIASEMTRFVDYMSKTDKFFYLW